MKDKALYTFSWNEGGYNQVYAYDRQQAIRIGNKMTQKLTVNEATINRIPKGQEDAYYRSISVD